MSQKLNEQQSLLQVVVSENQERQIRSELENLDLQIDPKIIFFDLERLSLPDGYLSIFSFYGSNLSMRLINCVSESEKMLFSTPIEPVVTFHIQMTNDHYSCFEGDANRSLWMTDQTRLFWQNQDTVIYELPYGFCNHLDLFFRPDHFLEMADRYPVLREMAMEVKTSVSGNLDFFVAQLDGDIHDLIDRLLDELQDYAVSKERFQHLIECLLLRCMGVVVPVEPIPDDAIHADDYYFVDNTPHTSQYHRNPSYYNREEFQKLVERMLCYTDVILKDKFYAEKLAYFDRKKNIVASRMLMNKIKHTYATIMVDVSNLVADLYLEIATCLDKQSVDYPLNESGLEVVAEAITFVCDQSFALRQPTHEALEMYHKWSKKSDQNMDEASKLLESFLSKMDMNLPKLDGSKESKAIFFEYIKEHFGMKPLSYFIGEQEKDKPKEVVELYHKLMQHLPDEFTITDDGEIKKSDLIRILDAAYDTNDVIPMLLVEIEHFSKDVQYVEQQSFEKICWWLLAIKEGNSDLHHQDLVLRQERLFGLMQVYESALDGMHALEWSIHQSREVFVDLASKLLKVRFRMEEQRSSGTFMLCVKAFIRAGDTYKLPKE
ncbi:hypothetical protein [Sphingobacterium anhuiense]|uniref:Uncharacterized protein n=1 Tax=Sphingobacterium anhuiense TaxID=493780 RepID=A0ABW5YXM8_9SPHI